MDSINTTFKSQMDYLITSNYDYLLKISRNITKKNKSDKDIKYTLLHQCVTNIYDKLESNNTFLEDTESFKKYLTKYMKQHYTWQYIRMINEQKDNDLNTYTRYEGKDTGLMEYDEIVDDRQELDEISQELIYLQCENVNDITKLYLKDLMLNDIPIDRGIMYTNIMNTIKLLTPVEQELFNLYFEQELTVKKIYNIIRPKLDKDPITYKMLLQMVKDLRIKIIELLKNDTN